MAYASSRGTAFLDRALYLPEVWAQDADRRAEAGVPETVAFATKGELAQRMLARAFAAQVPAAWVAGDTIYGGDDLRRWLEEQGRPYVLAVPCTHGLWTAGQQVEAQALVADVPDAAWARLSAGEESQGPRWYDWALLALPYDAPPGMAHWLLARRGISDPTEHTYYRVCGPAETPMAALVQVAGRRWCIETGALWADSRKRRGWWDWISTRCANGRRGTGTSR